MLAWFTYALQTSCRMFPVAQDNLKRCRKFSSGMCGPSFAELTQSKPTTSDTCHLEYTPALWRRAGCMGEVQEGGGTRILTADSRLGQKPIARWKAIMVGWAARSCPILLRPHACQAPRDSLGKNAGAGCHSLLQGIFLTQESNQVSCFEGGLSIDWATREAHSSLK